MTSIMLRLLFFFSTLNQYQASSWWTCCSWWWWSPTCWRSWSPSPNQTPSRWSSSKMRSNTSWMRRALTRRWVRTQMWRFYSGRLNVMCSVIKERLFAGSIRRRRRSETMRELRPRRAAPRWTWEGRAAAEVRLCWCSRGFLCRCNCDLPTILIFPVCEMMF